MAGILPIRVLAFLLLAVCGALCQQGEDKQALNSLPDAPSVQASAQAGEFVAFDEGRPPAIRGPIQTRAAAIPEVAHEARTAGTRPISVYLGSVYEDERVQKESGDFFEKYLSPSLAKRNVSYHPATSGSLVGRAAYAASNVFVTRDDSGKSRLNTSYFLAVLSSVAIHTAHRPYWNRPVSAPANDFGATIGNDAGMDLLHEFGPGLHQLVKSHTPRFVSRMEDRVAH
jgi:hypothetical protein